MYKKVITSLLLVSVIQINAMDKSDKDVRDDLFSIISSDGNQIAVPYKYAQHMGIFYPLNPETCAFRSQRNACEITKLIEISQHVEDRKIGPDCFTTQYDVVPHKSRMKLSDYQDFDTRLKADDKRNDEAIALMSLARELKDEQLGLILASFLIHKKHHNEMFSALMSKKKESSFQQKIDEICKNTYEPKRKHDTDHQDELAVWHKANKTITANANRTLVAMVDKKDKGLVTIQDKPGSIVQKLSQEGWPLTCLTFSDDGSLFACVNNCEGNYRNGFILFVWNVATWDLIIDARYLLLGNIHNMCFTCDGTRIIASVKAKKSLSPDGGIYISEYENVVIDIRDVHTKIIHRIPTHSIAQRMYWRADNTFVTSFERDGDIFDQWTFEKRKEKAGKKLNFAQKVLLYGLYERVEEEKIKYYPHKQKPFVAPLIAGYIKEYLVESLTKRLRVWVNEVGKKYRFKS